MKSKLSICQSCPHLSLKRNYLYYPDEFDKEGKISLPVVRCASCQKEEIFPFDKLNPFQMKVEFNFIPFEVPNDCYYYLEYTLLNER